MSSTYVADVAESLRVALMVALAEATTGRPPPSTSYLSHGLPTMAYCCDDGYAVVYLDPTDAVRHDLFSQPQKCQIVPSATFVLEWGRCVPTVTEAGWPDPADLDVSAEDLMEDLWAVLTELYDRMASGALHGAECGDVTIGPAAALEPRGGCAGWTVRVTINLADPGPSGS